ncbi:MAG TPA: GNAT family N-acetyltransferase [Steroidobacteraceae bacterium]|jgi:ribosomal protein S18 acetylase RimI-like enzyme
MRPEPERSETVAFRVDGASAAQIAAHLLRCDAQFVTALSGRVDILAYAQKIADLSVRFEAWSGDTLIGLVAAYVNSGEKSAYVTSVSVLADWLRRGIGIRLMRDCVAHARLLGLRDVRLEVHANNRSAVGLYEKLGFAAGETHAESIHMRLDLQAAEERSPLCRNR